MSTPQTSVLWQERACCRIVRTTSLSTASAGCEETDFDFAFIDSCLRLDCLRLRSQLAQNQRSIAVREVPDYAFAGAGREDIERRQPQLAEQTLAQIAFSGIRVQQDYRPQMSIVRALRLFEPHAAERSIDFFFAVALRANKFVHYGPAVLAPHVATHKVLPRPPPELLQREFVGGFRQMLDRGQRVMAHAIGIRRVFDDVG